MRDLRRLVSVVLVALLAAPAWAVPQATVPPPRDVARPQLTPRMPLSHQPADCMVSAAHPLIEAAAAPGVSVSSARVYYRSSKASDFSSIEMTRSGDQWEACLPAPTAQAASVTYFIAASTTDGTEQRTPEFTAAVVDDAGQCAARTIAPMASCADLAAPPPGFVAPAPPVLGGGGGGLLGSKAFLIASGAAVLGLVTVIAVNDKEPKSASR